MSPSPLAEQSKAIQQLLLKSQDCTQAGVTTFTITCYPDQGPEIEGEETFTLWIWKVLLKNKAIEKYREILANRTLKNLRHYSTRVKKIEMLKKSYNTILPPLQLPFSLLNDHDLTRMAVFDTLTSEGWVKGMDPPPSIQEWWGDDDLDAYKLYSGQNIPSALTKLIRDRFKNENMTAIGFFRKKLKDCLMYRLKSLDALELFTIKRNIEDIEVEMKLKEAYIKDGVALSDEDDSHMGSQEVDAEVWDHEEILNQDQDSRSSQDKSWGCDDYSQNERRSQESQDVFPEVRSSEKGFRSQSQDSGVESRNRRDIVPNDESLRGMLKPGLLVMMHRDGEMENETSFVQIVGRTMENNLIESLSVSDGKYVSRNFRPGCDEAQQDLATYPNNSIVKILSCSIEGEYIYLHKVSGFKDIHASDQPYVALGVEKLVKIGDRHLEN